MYTEENEFDYNDYLDENLNDSSHKPFFNIGTILKILFILLCIILIIFIVFSIKNHSSKGKNKDNSGIAFVDNLDKVRDASYIYFFTKNNLPKEEGKSLSVNVKKLIEENLITSIKDSNGKVCGYNTSNSTLTKNANEYEMKVSLICPSDKDTVTYYYSFDGKCLNCNGESYTPVPKNEESEIVPEPEVEPTPEVKPEPEEPEVKVCQDFSAWTTIYNADTNLERQTRTLVRGYKTETSYGEWSELSPNVITPTDKLDVRTVDKEEKVTTKTKWSKESTKKPKSKSGREISSRVVTKKWTTTSCTGGQTYTKTLTKWDNKAQSCQLIKIGKVVCTYKTQKVCKNVPHTKQTVYYKYRDTKTTTVQKTYYQARVINQTTTYTDYLLESNMPEGYTILPDSQRVEYRYREKCVSK